MSLRVASWRFANWDRSLAATTRTSSPSLARMRRTLSVGPPISARSHMSSTRESVLLTCWPPGPLEREKRQDSERCGILIADFVTSSPDGGSLI